MRKHADFMKEQMNKQVSSEDFKAFLESKFMKKLKTGETTGMNLSQEVIKIQMEI